MREGTKRKGERKELGGRKGGSMERRDGKGEGEGGREWREADNIVEVKLVSTVSERSVMLLRRVCNTGNHKSQCCLVPCLQ